MEKKTPEEVGKEIEKLLEENDCRYEIEFHDIKVTVVKKQNA